MSELIVLHGCATIQLTRGYNTLIDVDDWVNLSKRRWHAQESCGIVYARGRIGRQHFYIHRVIAGSPPGVDTDHANGDGLDNRKLNLRPCSRADNLANSWKRVRGSSRWKGVHWDKENRRWVAKICREGRQVLIGRFKFEHEAALAYNAAAAEVSGGFARLNDVVAPPDYCI